MTFKGKVLSFVVLAACTSPLVAATSAQATFHENYIREVHIGPGGTGDYVELQAYAGGQNFVAGKHIVTYDGGGTPYSTFTFPHSVNNGANQATILVSDGGVSGADFTATPGSGNDGTHLTPINTGGTVCYTDSSTTVGLDCVAYTSGPTLFPSPPPSPFGTPFTLPGGQLGPNQSLIRTISRGCATALDTADDTNNSAADFTIGAGSPRGNSVTPTETPCATPPATKKKCKKKKKKHRSAETAKKKKCKKKKHH
jgi:hypothetical protein